jgi:tRNA(fMet)-specific endonuclease VapC
VNLLREAGRQAPGPATRFLDAHLQDDLCVSVLVTCELHAGAELSARPSVERERVQQLCGVLRIAYPDERFAPVYGRLLASLTRAGRSISTMDLLIAASAMVDEAPLVTRNLKDFRRVPDLELLAY